MNSLNSEVSGESKRSADAPQSPPASTPRRSANDVEAEGRDKFQEGLAEGKDKFQEGLAEGKDSVKHIVTEARDEIRRPTTGAAIAGAAVVGAATIWGIPAAALGATAAYVVYRVLKKRSAGG